MSVAPRQPSTSELEWKSRALAAEAKLEELKLEIARLEERGNRLGESYKLMAEDNLVLRQKLRDINDKT